MDIKKECETEVRVLLCDDQTIVAEALKAMLSDCPGLQFLHVTDPKNLLTVVNEFKPTVILQDLVLPETTGIEVLKTIRAQSTTHDLPVILLSTTEDARIKYDAFAAGASDYVVKFPEAFELIGRILYHSKAYCNLRAREYAHKILEQKSRLESLGNLAAGIAHEINTPLQYISANLSYLKEALTIFSQNTDTSEIHCAITETIEGVEQISSIVRAMKAFAHPGKQDKVLCNINGIIQDIKLLSRNEWKDYSTFSFDLDCSIPPVACCPGAIAQVLLNLVVNAAQAIKSRTFSDGDFGEIKVLSRIKESNIEIEVKDNGGGIPKDIQDKIFEPFFTTKEIGDGSGQGLSLSRSIILESHKGELDFTSLEGMGTSFYVRIPLLTTLDLESSF